MQGQQVLPNPHGDHILNKPLMPIQPEVAESLFQTTRYVAISYIVGPYDDYVNLSKSWNIFAMFAFEPILNN